MNGNVSNCIVKLRSQEDILFKQMRSKDGEDFLVASLDGYAIVPKEEYERLRTRAAATSSGGN